VAPLWRVSAERQEKEQTIGSLLDALEARPATDRLGGRDDLH
jgi:hypothetical protein